MSMDEQDCRNAYVECLACDQAIFTLGGQDSQAQYVTLSNGDGRLHTHCRAQYEADNGPVVCESDEASVQAEWEAFQSERDWQRRIEDGAMCEPQSVTQAKAFVEKQQAKGRR